MKTTVIFDMKNIRWIQIQQPMHWNIHAPNQSITFCNLSSSEIAALFCAFASQRIEGNLFSFLCGGTSRFANAPADLDNLFWGFWMAPGMGLTAFTADEQFLGSSRNIRLSDPEYDGDLKTWRFWIILSTHVETYSSRSFDPADLHIHVDNWAMELNWHVDYWHFPKHRTVISEHNYVADLTLVIMTKICMLYRCSKSFQWKWISPKCD